MVTGAVQVLGLEPGRLKKKHEFIKGLGFRV